MFSSMKADFRYFAVRMTLLNMMLMVSVVVSFSFGWPYPTF